MRGVVQRRRGLPDYRSGLSSLISQLEEKTGYRVAKVGIEAQRVTLPVNVQGGTAAIAEVLKQAREVSNGNIQRTQRQGHGADNAHDQWA